MRFHLIGIGGTGMCGLALLLREAGHAVSGSDAVERPSLPPLREIGIDVRVGHAAANVPAGTERVVHSTAVKPDNPERAESEARGIPRRTYAEALGELLASRKVIALSGTHGKSTSAAMGAFLLDRAGLRPGYLVGAPFPQLGASARWGDPNGPFVLEACEYDRSFLRYRPFATGITNVDLDHVDYFGSWEGVRDAFAEFVARTDPEGLLVLSAWDPATVALREAAPCPVRTISTDGEADWRAVDVARDGTGTSFSIDVGGTRREGYRLGIPGLHNVGNALTVLALAEAAGADPDRLREALPDFRGAGRRFEIHRLRDGGVLVDDYAHHPVEIAAVIDAARQRFPGRRLVFVFQPHQYVRTRAFLPRFAEALAAADEAWIVDIYGVREETGSPVSAGDLAVAVEDAGGRALEAGSPKAAADRITAEFDPSAVWVLASAGDLEFEVAGILSRLAAPESVDILRA